MSRFVGRLLLALVALCLSATVALGYLVWQLSERLDDSHAELAAAATRAERDVFDSVAEAEDRLDDKLQAVVAAMPDAASIRSDLSALETAVFGPLGAGPRRDALGKLEADVRQLDSALEALKLCANNAFATLDTNVSREIAALASVLAGGFYNRPLTLAPRCF